MPNRYPGYIKGRNFHMDSQAQIRGVLDCKTIVYKEGCCPEELLYNIDYIPCFPFFQNALQPSLEISKWRPDDIGYQIIIKDIGEDDRQ